MARKRALRMLLLPILAPLFLLGWVLTRFGKQSLSAKRKAHRLTKEAKDESVQFGLLSEMNEEWPLLENFNKSEKAKVKN